MGNRSNGGAARWARTFEAMRRSRNKRTTIIFTIALLCLAALWAMDAAQYEKDLALDAAYERAHTYGR